MATTRLFYTGALAAGQELRLGKEPSHRLVRVLRMVVGDEFVLFNGDGGEYTVTLSSVERGTAIVRVQSFASVQRESTLHVILAQGISKGQKMDFTIQKAVELGVSRISPLSTERSVVKLTPARAAERLRHWESIVVSACEQCGRTVIPPVDSPQPFERWISQCSGTTLILNPTASRSFSDIKPTSAINVLIGPEGGLSAREIEMAEHFGAESVRMGPRTLRTETASVTALSVLQYVLGDLGDVPPSYPSSVL